jgi:drug/metabolite transporter (DMT)-like permease
MFLYFMILSHKEVYEITVLWPVIMILTIILGNLIIKEKINWKQWIGIFLTFIGISITLFYKNK